MTLLARTIEGTPLIGDETGFIRLDAAYPEIANEKELLYAAANNELSIPDSTLIEAIAPENLSFSIPLEQIGKLWGIGLNYSEHASDLDEDRPNEPASFMKPRTTATGPGGPIRLPSTDLTDKVTAEAELGVIVGKTCSDLTTEEAKEVIAGYIPLIDMTAEDILEKNPRFLTRSKSFDTFLVIGPWITTTDEIEALHETSVKTIINGDVKAQNVISNMKTRPRELVAYHSHVMTLEPGDVISTGTPGAHVVRSGDTAKAAVESVGTVSADVLRDK